MRCGTRAVDALGAQVFHKTSGPGENPLVTTWPPMAELISTPALGLLPIPLSHICAWSSKGPGLIEKLVMRPCSAFEGSEVCWGKQRSGPELGVTA